MYIGSLPHLIELRSSPWNQAVQDTQGEHDILIIIGRVKVSIWTIMHNGGPIHLEILAAGGGGGYACTVRYFLLFENRPESQSLAMNLVSGDWGEDPRRRLRLTP